MRLYIQIMKIVKGVSLFLFLILGLHILNAFGQKVASRADKGKFLYRTLGTGEARYLLKGDTLEFDNGICGYFGRLLKPLIREDKDGKLMLDSGFFIQQCLFRQNAKTVSSTLQECYTLKLRVGPKAQGYLAENTFDQALVISGLSGKLGIIGNNIPYFFYSGARQGSLDFQQNKIASLIHITNIRNSNLDLTHNLFSLDTARIIVNGSRFDQVLISGNDAKHMQMDFLSDTIEYFQSFGKLMSDSTEVEKPQDHNFDHSVLRTVYIDSRPGPVQQTIKFTDCTFQPDAVISFSHTDTIAFIDCNHTGPGLRLYGTEKNRTAILKIRNTDLTNIRFDYDRNFKLYQWPDMEVTSTIYEQLLVKFSVEKRQRSYQRVDIEYFRYKNNALVNFLALIWWNYGYDKWYILVWTIGFLLVFSIINFLNWKSVSETYAAESNRAIGETTNLPERFWKVFIYTSIIFFSLKVDFEKLSFKKTGALTYFFAIYLCGLLCLFFIANAILRI